MKAKEKSSQEKTTLSSDEEKQSNSKGRFIRCRSCGPYASSVAGEEDPGVALEVVESNKK